MLSYKPIDVDNYPYWRDLNGLLIDEGNVGYLWEYSPGGTLVVYIADQLVNEKWELFATFEVSVFLPLVMR